MKMTRVMIFSRKKHRFKICIETLHCDGLNAFYLLRFAEGHRFFDELKESKFLHKKRGYH